MKKFLVSITFSFLLQSAALSQASYHYNDNHCGGYAIGFNETSVTNSFLASEIPLYTNATSLTLCAWIQPSVVMPTGREMGIAYRKFFVNSLQRGWVEYGIYLNAKGELMFRGNIAPANGVPDKLDSLSSGYVPQKGTWCHVAATFDEVTYSCNLYANGQLVATKKMEGPLAWKMAVGGNYDPMTIGAVSISNGSYFATSGYFQGIIDDVLFSVKPLNKSQIDSVASAPPNETFSNSGMNIFDFYRFNEGRGNSIKSAQYVYSNSGYGYTAYPGGSPGWVFSCVSNKLPVANAGPDRIITLPTNSVTLDGSSSADPDGSIVKYEWTKVSGPSLGGGTIASPQSVITSVTGLNEGTYVFRLTVTDNSGGKNSDDVQITIQNNDLLVLSPLNLVQQDGSIENNFSKIDINKKMKGAATDGVSKLIIFVESGSDIKFSIPNHDQSKGTLSDFSLKNGSQEVVGRSQNNRVAIIYTVPDGYGDQYSLKSGRSIQIIGEGVTDPTKKYQCNVQLYSPPVVLVHGMWSAPKTAWVDTKFQDALEQKGFKVTLADYDNDDYKTFDPTNPESLIPRTAVYVAILQALKKYEENQILAAEVDVVAHSLGGLMTRSFAQWQWTTDWQNAGLNKRNFNEGYVHKLITLGTPHKGSPLGPLLYNGLDDYFRIFSVGSLLPENLAPIRLLFSKFINPVGSCHRDFNPDISQNIALQNLDATDRAKIKKVHAIVGIAGYGEDYNSMDRFCLLMFRSPLAAILQNDEHDLIVSKKSQLGGLTMGINATPFSSTAHSNPPGFSWLGYETETHNPLIQEKVSKLLQTSNNSLFSLRFPAPINARIIQQNISGKSPLQRTQSNDSAIIKLKTQSRGIQLTPDQTEIEISFTEENGAKIKNPILILQDIGWLTFPNNPPYTIKIPIPKNINTHGRIPFCVIGRDTSGLLLADTSSLIVETRGVFYKLEVSPSAIEFDSICKESCVRSVAYFIYGNDTLQYLLDKSSEVTYRTLYNKVIVRNDGYVEPIMIGIDSIEVSYNNRRIIVPVSISTNFSSSKKVSNKIEFSLADRELDNVPFVLHATATSGNEVQFKLIDGPVGLVNDVCFIRGPGKVTIQATSKGDAYFEDASITKTFCVSPLQSAEIVGDTITCTSEKTYLIKKDPLVNYEWAVTGGTVLKQNEELVTIKWLTPGVQTIEVKPTVDGCYGKTRTLKIRVTSPQIVNVTALGNTSFCEGDSIKLSTNSVGDSYQWYRNDTLITRATQPSFTTNQGGNYFVTINTLQDGCNAKSSAIAVAVKVSPQTPKISVLNSLAFCPGDSLTLTSSAASGSQWYKDGNAINSATNKTYVVKTGGSYTVKATTNGCSSGPSEAIVPTILQLPNGNITTTSSGICPGGTAQLTASGGNSYQWYKDTSAIPGAISANYNATVSGIYTADIVSSNGCKVKASNSITLTTLNKPNASFSFDSYCVNVPVTFNNTTSGNNISYQWNFGDNQTSTNVSPQHTYSKNGIYTISLIASLKNCLNSNDTIQKIIRIEAPLAGIKYPTVSATYGKPQQLSARNIGKSYQWIPPTDLDNAKSRTPVLTPTADRKYKIQITMPSGCIITDSLDVAFLNDIKVLVPTAFAPNGNGSNDLLRPILLNIVSIKYFRVYNRWGQQLFETKSLNEGWNGIYQGNPQPMETYTWIFEGTDVKGNPVKASGKSVLIR